MSPAGGQEYPPEPKRKRKKSDILYVGLPPISTSNTYSPLAQVTDNDDMDAEESATIAPNASPSRQKALKKERIPPITVAGKNRSQIVELCKTCEVKNYRLKMTSTGINLFCSTVDEFKKMKIILKNDNTQYYTHALIEERELRVILKGLFTMTEQEIRDSLKEVGVHPKSVRQLNPKKRKFTDQAHYVLSFPLGIIKLSTLKQIRFVAHCSVDWDFYSPRKFGPTRCHNCNMFGHGISQCQMQTKCPVCAEGHKIDECPNVDDNGNLKDGCKLKCSNCKGEHAVTHENCPKLIEYLQIQERIAAKNSGKTKPRQFVPTQKDFPSLTRNQPYQTQHIPIGNAWTNGPQQTFLGQNSLHSPELMTPTEIIQLTQELMISLRNCKSREDQFNVVVSMAVKYLGKYGQP